MPVLLALNSNSMFTTVYACINITMLLTLPVGYGVLLRSKRAAIPQEATKAKFGSLFLGISFLNIWQAWYSVLFLMRRLIFAAILIFLDERPYIVVLSVVALNLSFIIYLAEIKPHNQPAIHKLELLNECFLQAISYHLMISMISTGVMFD